MLHSLQEFSLIEWPCQTSLQFSLSRYSLSPYSSLSFLPVPLSYTLLPYLAMPQVASLFCLNSVTKIHGFHNCSLFILCVCVQPNHLKVLLSTHSLTFTPPPCLTVNCVGVQARHFLSVWADCVTSGGCRHGGKASG